MSERPPTVPREHWRQLGEISHIERGQSPPLNYVIEGLDHGLPFVQGNTEFGDRYPQPKCSCATPTKLGKSGSVLIAVCPWAGKINLADQDYCIGGGVAAIFPRQYPATFVAAAVANQSSELARVSQGTIFDAISKRELHNLYVYSPELSTAEKIAEILDTLDTAIQATETVVMKLQAIKQGLLNNDLLTRGIDENGDLRPPQSEAPHLYRQTPLGWLPKEWEVDHLSSFASVHGGKRLPAGHTYTQEFTGYKYLRVTDFFRKSFNVAGLKNLEESTFNALERYEISAGQLYISIAGSLGYVGVFPENTKDQPRTILTENAARIVLSGAGNPKFFSIMMNSGAVQKQVEWEKGTGGGVPKLALFRIAKFLVFFPSTFEQDTIAAAYDKICHREVLEHSLLDKLRLIKSGLMDDLLTGRVPIKPQL